MISKMRQNQGNRHMLEQAGREGKGRDRSEGNPEHFASVSIQTTALKMRSYYRFYQFK